MKGTSITKRRSFLILLLVSLLFSGLIVRLWWIQIAATHSFSPHKVDLVKAAVKQRQQAITLNSGRGDIVDRNGTPLTGIEKRALIIFPLARGSVEATDNIKQIAKIANVSEQQIIQLIQNGKSPTPLTDHKGAIIELTESQMTKINQLQVPGILAVTMTERYAPISVAKHVIGYVSQNPERIKKEYEEDWKSGKMTLETAVGASGIEKSFDRFLQGMEPSTLSYYVDGQGNPLRGLQTRFSEAENSFYPLTIKTTLHLDIQQAAEEALQQAGIEEGAIIVLDVATSDVLAMASRPLFDPHDVEIDKGNWQNQAVKQIAPGSVLKTVVAAAALEDGVVSPTEEFNCSGSYGKYGFSCWKKEGHGKLTLAEAFAESCNITFAEVAKRLGGERLQQQAEKMGITMKNGWNTEQLFKMDNFSQVDGEHKGQLFADQKPTDDEGILIQTAIGQRDAQITPLQAANMMAMIARGGEAKQVRLVSRIEYRNGSSFTDFQENELPVKGLDAVVSQKLRKMMGNVIQEGTATSLKNLPISVAGKTGTAQVTHKGEPAIHQWFAGFAPVDNPEYAIVVVAKNQSVTSPNRSFQAISHLFSRLWKKEAQSSLQDVSPSGE
ncbi:peptidoglycan D,D-transpeptidase FtsI family protein [Brevibacillus daliensis]|uniref:peptidoglycan D,D-transpeptidase FtsI family protein n=1 Tax=Brevibacillus daliensis TaxID=2892995 RepID=UPI001E47AE8A|nr:penicillin-binding transpeptidase domain-containing protein [Brevibacillus daliensis]